VPLEPDEPFDAVLGRVATESLLSVLVNSGDEV
jgi:hypothetical protein